MTLTLYNTLTRRKEPFAPLDPSNVRMYVCGPTVYDYAHIGNARPVIVFDVLFRLLRHIYGPEHVTYARNITDVDDKINARAADEGIPIRELTERTAKQFHEDIRALGVLMPEEVNEPDKDPVFIEPRATDHIEEMKRLIDELVANGHAYVADGHVLFDVSSMADYGRLANRSLDEMEAGARVDVAPYKRGPMDFVLWKPSKPGEPGWPSPSGIAAPGRPGWHIECSAMAEKHLGQVFDIHGGGIDLVFPHHENEIAQSRCAHGTPLMAQVWMHNGFLQVEGEKMSKSLGNFVTIRELLDGWRGQKWDRSVIRLLTLSTHYRQPLDWTVQGLEQARNIVREWENITASVRHEEIPIVPSRSIMSALCDDLNTPAVVTSLQDTAKAATASVDRANQLYADLVFLGLFADRQQEASMSAGSLELQEPPTSSAPLEQIEQYERSLGTKLFILSSNLNSSANTITTTSSIASSISSVIGPLVNLTNERGELKILEPWILHGPKFISSRDLRNISAVKIQVVNDLIEARNAGRKAKDFKEADRIRDELSAMGIQLKDSKDPTTGEIVTTWEVKR